MIFVSIKQILHDIILLKIKYFRLKNRFEKPYIDTIYRACACARIFLPVFLAAPWFSTRSIYLCAHDNILLLDNRGRSQTRQGRREETWMSLRWHRSSKWPAWIRRVQGREDRGALFLLLFSHGAWDIDLPIAGRRPISRRWRQLSVSVETHSVHSRRRRRKCIMCWL